MTRQIILFLTMGLLLGLQACSDDVTHEYTADDAQKVYDGIRGTYVGAVVVDNVPKTVYVTIDTAFTVRNLPLKPILQRIFTDEAELNEAIISSRDAAFTAPTENMAITVTGALLTMQTTDWPFKVHVGDQDYNILVTATAQTWKPSMYHNVTVSIDVLELYCNNVSYDVKTVRLNYYIDSAEKQEQSWKNKKQ